MPYKGIWLMTKKMRRVHYLASQMLDSSTEMDHAYSRPHQLLIECDLGLGRCHLREEGRERLDEIEESYCTALAGSLDCITEGGLLTSTHLDG